MKGRNEIQPKTIHTANVALLVLALALGFALSASAADGRIPIGGGAGSYYIGSPGDYYLTGDLTWSGTVITIAAGNVRIDLNGHTVTNTAGTYSTIAAGGASNLDIFGGSVVGGAYGVYVSGATMGVIALHHLRITGFTNVGITIIGASQYPAIRVTDNDISCYGAAGTSAQAIAMSQVWGGRVSSNTLMGQSPSGTGIGIIINTSGDGLLIVDNSVTYFQAGMSIGSSSGLKILRNDVFSNAVGITISGGGGIDVQENLIASNTGVGLSFSSVTGCVYRSNTSQNNGTAYSIPGSGVTNAGGNY